ncbi:hypothetical protein N5079_12630 [Planotetraspora sp. A-T 1434]|uniref:hypothetical protein n=1 Tax=Planotetraspora sp. A-T 1434 TaxID=2979219 RepID=UPI0021BF4197|nr:hypothetical protein [Planotetraspora sp. A-T 1434]MCT9931061.1 hypothetical protein [Planotetraspora sp. A-T 1434]
MSPGDYGTKAVPTYVAAEAETTPLPKITVPEAPPPPSSGKGLGDLPMRVVYRTIATVAAVAVVGVAGTAVVLAGHNATSQSTPGNVPGNTVAAAGAGAPAASPADLSGSVPSAPPSPVPGAVPSAAPSGGVSGGVSGGPSIEPSAVASPSPSPGTTAMDAALSDPRVPVLPASSKKLRNLPGKSAATRGLIKDRRSGVAFPRFAKVWKLAKASPFASRQVLPKVKGSAFRGLLVSCPVPIPVQDSLRDTAFLAARWTLNHHPSGATITWAASQPIRVGKQDGWLLGYNVHYTLKGKKRTSMAAIALVDVSLDKPALVFVTIPDTQKKHWRDINTVMSRIKLL